jgi:hypothetical protein
MNGFGERSGVRTVAHRMLAVHITDAHEPLAELARALEPDAFAEPYERASLFFVAVEDGRAVGMIRVIAA